MKRALALLIVAVISVATLNAAQAGGPLVVHEWGTFTSMQGSSGLDLEGMQHETERLPSFVHSRTASQASPFRDFGDTSYDETLPGNQRLRRVRGKMETPVIYFYADCPYRVKVHVDFVGGLLTQWYPRASAAVPAFDANTRPDADLSKVTRSSLDWELDVIPIQDSGRVAMPFVPKNDPWQFAREVRASAITAVGSKESDRYVFYRGLGRTEQALQVEAHPNGVALVRNPSDADVVAAFALDMGATEGSFRALGALPAGSEHAIRGNAPRLPKAQVVAQLETAVHAALVADGLYADEATAMVRTWSSTWFGTEGTRIVYLFPRKKIDALIPLTITPTPKETVRVMVGRLEYMTPESELALAAALRDATSPDAKVRASASERLARRGRFLEASVRRVQAINPEPAVRAGAAEVLARY